MSELAKRALTGAAYVALTLGAAWAGPVTTTLLFLPACVLAAREMHRLTWGSGPEPPPVEMPMFVAAATYMTVALSGFLTVFTPMGATAALLIIFTIAATDILLRNEPDPVKHLGALLMNLLYIALPFGLVTYFLTNGPGLFIGFMLLLWANDTGAYLVGRAIGRTKLLALVSPMKTMEGLIGGIAFAIMVAILVSRTWPMFSMAQWTACAVVVAIMSTLGDLLESAFKRAAGVKDAGDLLPGHGGILDRFDGFLLAAPSMLVCVHLMS